MLTSSNFLQYTPRLFWFLSEKRLPEKIADIQPVSFVRALSYLQANLAAFVFRKFSCGDEESFFGSLGEGWNMNLISASQAIFVNCKEVRYGTR